MCEGRREGREQGREHAEGREQGREHIGHRQGEGLLGRYGIRWQGNSRY